MPYTGSVKKLSVVVLALTVACGGDDGSSTADAGSPDSGIPSDVRPGKRSDTGGVFDPGSGLLAVFGGDNGPIVNQTPMASYVGDTWVFSPTDGWSEVMGAGPSTRGRHAVAHDPAGRMLLFGGRFRTSGQAGNYTLYNDLWAFDFAAKTWTMLDPGSAAGPTSRYFSAAVFSAAEGLTVYGGGTNLSGLNLTPVGDVWRYQSGAWTELTTTGTPPSLRLFVAYTYDSTRNRLVVYGGQPGDFVSPALVDLHALDVATGVWTQLSDGSGSAPSGRFSGSLVYDSAADRYLLFGGHADPGVANDTWAFDPTTDTWSEFRGADSFTGGALGCMGNPRELPKGYVTEDVAAPERRSGGVFVMLDGLPWLFGGESDCSDHLDDVWRLDASGWSEVIGARSGESCARRGDDCTCLCL